VILVIVSSLYKHLQVFVLLIVILLAQGAITTQILWLVLLFVPSKVDCEHAETGDKHPAEQVVDEAKEGDRKLDFGVELGYHRHLAAVSHLHFLS